MLRLFFLAAAMICCIGLYGCDFPEQKRPVSSPGGLDLDGGAAPAGQSTDTPQAQPADPPAPPAPLEARKTVEVGDGRKGHYGRMSIFQHNIGTFYRTKERLTYNVQIPQAMQLYKATNDRTPRDHDEFMKDIIQANNIKLPELREGCRYEYNPETAELEIVYPLDMMP